MLAARPDTGTPGTSGDVLLCGTAPRRKLAAIRAEAQRVLLEMAGPEPEAPQKSADDATTAPAEEAAAV